MSLPIKVYRRLPRRFPKSLGFSKWALDFDGTDDRVEHADFGIAPLSSITLEAFVYTRSIGAGQYIFGFEGDPAVLMAITADGDLYFWMWGTDDASYSQTAGITLSANRWYHLACIFDRPDLYMYRNGVEVWSGFLVDLDISSRWVGENAEWIGMLGHYASGPFNGIIDEPRAYSRALSLDELHHNIINYHDPVRSGLILWDRFEEGQGTIAYDSSPTGNNGTLAPAGGPPEWSRRQKWELRSVLG